MSFGGKALTAHDLERRQYIHAGNCMACLVRDINVAGQGVVQWHHLSGRQHHDRTVGLCCWHHQGYPFPGWSLEDMRHYYGPSLAEGSVEFHAEFGSNAELLERQNSILRILGFTP